jgi:hypothetical protein
MNDLNKFYAIKLTRDGDKVVGERLCGPVDYKTAEVTARFNFNLNNVFSTLTKLLEEMKKNRIEIKPAITQIFKSILGLVEEGSLRPKEDFEPVIQQLEITLSLVKELEKTGVLDKILAKDSLFETGLRVTVQSERAKASRKPPTIHRSFGDESIKALPIFETFKVHV